MPAPTDPLNATAYQEHGSDRGEDDGSALEASKDDERDRVGNKEAEASGLIPTELAPTHGCGVEEDWLATVREAASRASLAFI